MTDSWFAADSAVAAEAYYLPWELAASVADRSGQVPPAGTDRERGAERFDLWTRMVPFRGTQPEVESALSPFGVDATELTTLLGESQRSLRARLEDEPTWSRTFVAAWRTYHTGNGTPAADRRGQDDDLPDDLAFLEISRPLLAYARAGLVAELAGLAGPIAAIPELTALPEILASSLPLAPLAVSVRRMCVLEINVARVKGRLAGDSPQERFHDFQRLLRDPDYVLALWRAYPVLARYQIEVLDAWRKARVEFARHLLADFSSLVDTVWDSRSPGALVAVDFGAGDTHRGGRSVAVVRFTENRVVYKPRVLIGDLAFNRYLEWFNGHRPPHRMRVPQVLVESDHGWVEFVEHQACDDAGDISAFYWRTGALLALVHSLNGADFHLENVIAAGGCPVAVDLEALFHTRLEKTGGQTRLADPAAETLDSSVLRVGLLPRPWMVRDEDTNQFRRVDISGIGAAESVSSLAPVPVVDGENTDEMRIVRKHLSGAGAANRPRLADGTATDPLAHGDQVLDGFTFAYERIRQDRAELLRPGGLIDGFGRAPIRIILRPTQTYARLLEESTHPDFLQDALDRDRSLARLCQGLDDGPTRYPLMAAEIRALRVGDIPIFAARPDSRDIRLDNGDRVARVLPTTPIEVVRGRLQRMGRADLAFQQRIIRASYTIARASRRPRTAWATVRPIPRHDVPSEELVERAEEIGLRLVELAVRDRERIGWLGLSWVDQCHWQMEPAGRGLYQGLPGIGMLLTYLAAETDRPLWADQAGLVARTVAAQLKNFIDNGEVSGTRTHPGDQTGFFGEAVGAVNLLLHAGHVLGDGELFTCVAQALPALEHLLDHDRAYDVVAGNAGLLLSMLAVHEVLPDVGALGIAQSCAEHLIAHRVQTEEGHNWLSPAQFATAPLAGMAHGAAGIALALARIHRIDGDQRWVEGIESALRYENTLYDADSGNWRDLRTLTNDTDATSMYAWCHGAPGIGLARHEMLSCGLPEHVYSTLEADLIAALRATWRIMVSSAGYLGVGNHGICHGDLGNVELLAAVPRSWRPRHAASHAHGRLPVHPPVGPGRVIAAVLADARKRGWQCGLPSNCEAVGLMPGIAGIGYQLLHLARPSRVPSILRMQPPVMARNSRGTDSSTDSFLADKT
ncbi:MAG TPA: type 2 lanthipeptide synthetase LanM family protein [Amycolatopsis sp.]|uniref:type 2 lanthipeptide synthetase LanM family protein n=1 Tax=Amycolatopsis sp. TaxID=37632 RepID=UPI002B477F83|nr:type 2 lanthipeptide synthetase LanM family protein [Amycolatopsis sp.]HKS47040.1 type 2 lanthipeptide synthetase LanM family protein [Amycolatopsis sp.]